MLLKYGMKVVKQIRTIEWRYEKLGFECEEERSTTSRCRLDEDTEWAELGSGLGNGM